MLPQNYIDSIIEKSTFRRNVYNMIPPNSQKILDFGCGNGALLLRLQRDKKCTELFGVEVNSSISHHLNYALDGLFHINIENSLEDLENFKGFFKYIILHDVIEHLFDPWFTLTKIRDLLSDDGKIIIATPNIHHWRLQYKIHQGLFPYGNGLWHTGHLRWYTPISLLELLIIGGLDVEKLFLEIPDNVNFQYLSLKKDIRIIQIPPPEFEDMEGYENKITVKYDNSVKQYYPVFYAHKIIASCKKGSLLFNPCAITYNSGLLEDLRKAINLPFDIYSPPAMHPLIGSWC